MNTNPKYALHYKNWVRKDIWILEDAICLLLNVEPLKRQSLINKNQKFQSIYSDILDTAEIAAVLGHKTLAMVQRYAHLSEQHTTSVVERMNKAVFGDQ